MQRVLLLTIVATAVLASCRKNYQCACSGVDGDEFNYQLYGKLTKKKAETECNTLEALYSFEYDCVPKEQ